MNERHDCATHPDPHRSCYIGHGCRCEGCRTANREYQKKVRRRGKEWSDDGRSSTASSPRDNSWMAHPDRRCADVSWDELFGPVETQRRLAVELCESCPVLTECRAQGEREPWGLYGGRAQGTHGRPRLAGFSAGGRDGEAPTPAETGTGAVA